MDAKIGTKIMSEVSSNETHDILIEQLESLVGGFSDELGNTLRCNSYQDSSKVTVPRDIATENIYFSLGGSIDSDVDADSIVIPEASILQLIQSELPLAIDDAHNITEVSSLSINETGFYSNLNIND